MSNLPRRDKEPRDFIDVPVGDFSHDRLYPDLNPELCGSERKVPTEEEYYAMLADQALAIEAEREENDRAMQAAMDSDEFGF